ncbi:hypothetical protein TSUD_288060 [Trifolium subterraneum]|uniref:Reverse transcriptase domain-containing protein n=1 Tax=Trifolium subterraneum TaxID=3900 RepID=A0A1B5Z7C8_TRISU|nr:hypothetical protein TSUD_288060 [Trifolium subterraneum]
MFTGFKVSNTGLSVSHLQYADDTLFIGEASMENLWYLKAILRSFELASGLKVNFYKSSIMGINVSSEFLGVAERFLHCRIGSIPFIYLGLPVRANHRQEVTWQPLLDSLTKQLRVWRNKYASLGGRVVLLNSVLNFIPIFYLSFMKMPVCKLKSDGGLGVRDLRVVNLALLGKWRWRIISGGVGIWRDIILARYGSLFPSPHLGGRRNDSGGYLAAGGAWGIPLKTQFQRLFQVSAQSTNMVSEMGNLVEGQWVCYLRWRRDLLVGDLNLLEIKPAFLELSHSRDDDAIFSVEEERLLPKVWKTWAPSKVAVFSWQLLQDRWLGVKLVPSRGVLGFFDAFLGMGTVGYPPYFMLEPIEFGGCLVGSHWVMRIGGPLVACPTCG